MFIGRVYENHKKTKQTLNTNTCKEQAMKRQSNSKSRSSDEETDEESKSFKNAKNSANVKKSRYMNESSVDTDKESELEDFSQEPRKEAVDKSFMERINEKVKKLKKDKDCNESKVNGFSGDSKQVVYSIPSRDIEKGSKNIGKSKKNNSKDKFDSIELDNGEIKDGVKSVAIQATPYPPFRLRVLPHPDWQVCMLI